MLTIVIPTLNEEELLATLLESIKNQTLQPAELIVADAGSTVDAVRCHWLGALLTGATGN